MALLDIIETPDPLLKTTSAPIDHVDDALRTFMDDMLETMYAAPGIGLAAIQVAIPKRVIVIDVQDREEGEKNPLFFVNPEIVASSEETSVYQEGCLSIPGQFADVERPASVTVRYLDYHGNQHIEEMDGLLATCMQHEVDHLNGILFIDHLSHLKRKMILKKLAKARKDAVIA
ncbi:MAG: peptide deformylase [Pseudomonadota bacterium]